MQLVSDAKICFTYMVFILSMLCKKFLFMINCVYKECTNSGNSCLLLERN